MIVKDIFRVIKKEIIELKINRAFIAYYVYITIFAGIIMPLFTEFNVEPWGVSTYLLNIICIVSVIISSTLISDSFAGEKERNTLETLISTPISVISLYLGKVFFSTIITMFIVLIAHICNIIIYTFVSLIQTGTIDIPFNEASYFIYFISTFSITFFINCFGAILSINSKNIKSCNLLIMLITTPILAPIIFLLNQKIVMYEAIKIYAIILIVLSISSACYINIFLTKNKIAIKLD